MLVGYGGCMAARGVIMDPQGQWTGPWPLAGADDCRTQLFPDGRFEMECRGKEIYAATGKWRRESNHLVFMFNLYIKGGQKIEDMRNLTLRIDGAKNTMCVGQLQDRGEPYCWRRAKP